MTTVSQEHRYERRKNLAFDVLAGCRSVAGTARWYGVSDTTVRKACKEYGVDLDLARERLKATVMRHVKNGSHIEMIKENCGVDDRFIELSQRSFSLDEKGQHKKPTLSVYSEIVADLINTKSQLKYIAKFRKVAESTVSRIYSALLENNVPMTERVRGKDPITQLKIAITIDDALDIDAEFFRHLTNRFSAMAEIHLLAGKAAGSLGDLVEEFQDKGIKYDYIAITDYQKTYVLDRHIQIWFVDDDDKFRDLPDSVTIFKPRGQENFDFSSGKWLYTADTGEEI